MGKVIFVFLFVFINITPFGKANSVDRATFFYQYWNASKAMWEHTQRVKNTSDYHKTYEEYATTFSPSDFLSLASPRSNFFSFLSVLRLFLENNEADNAQRVIDKYNFLFPNNLAEKQLLETGRDRYTFSVPRDVIFWKIPSDGKCSYRQLKSKCELYYTEIMSREITADGQLEDVCRVTLQYKSGDDNAVIFSFYPSRKEDLFVFVKEKSKEVVVLLRRLSNQNSRPDVFDQSDNIVFAWFLYTFNLKSIPYIPLADSCAKDFDGYYGLHQFLKEIKWDASKGVEIYFKDLLPSENPKEGFVWKTVRGQVQK